MEISGYQQRVLYQKGPLLTDQELTKLFYSGEGEERILQRRVEVDEELDRLNDALRSQDASRIEACRARLAELTRELNRLEW
ncbi:hypothetical protein D3C75_1271520 [compost metagenome]